MTSGKTLFSILIANYNNGKFFKNCYESIIKQTYSNWEVIIVDDASTDNSLQIIKNIISKDSRFKLFVNETNKGCGFTKNRCVAVSSGDVLGFLDPDDALTYNALEHMVAEHKDPAISIVSSKYDQFDAHFNYLAPGRHGSAIPNGKSIMTYGQGAVTHFASFKRLFYDLTIGINQEFKRAVDYDLYLKLEEQGKHSYFNKVLYKYRFHSSGISQGENQFKAQYWQFRAVIHAYRRRRKLHLKIDNFSKNEMKLYKSKYYISRMKRSTKNKKYISKYYFLIKSITVFPSHKLNYKLKSLIIYNYY